jgi:hypothetical protein
MVRQAFSAAGDTIWTTIRDSWSASVVSLESNASLFRYLLTFITLSMWAYLSDVWNYSSGIMEANLSVGQLSNDYATNIQAYAGMRALHGNPGWVTVIVAVIIGVIWGMPLIRFLKTYDFGKFLQGFAILVVAGSVLTLTSPAWALWDEGNPEPVEISPNQTAFAIPLEGDNLRSQGKFMSVDFLNDKKVAAKRYLVPYKKYLTNTGVQYLPTVKLIMVERTPVTRVFTARKDTGTSTANQGFPAETKEGIGLTASFTLSAFVTEEDSATFLYWYAAGVKNRSNSTSTADGKSLAEVVDTNVRGAIQAFFSRELGKRSLDDATKQKAEIVEAVKKDIVEQFARQGITITSLGLADQFEYDNPEIQKAIDRNFIAGLDVQTANRIKDSLEIFGKKADIDIRLMNAQATLKMAERYTGGVPTQLTLMGDKMPMPLMMLPTPGGTPGVPGQK